MLDPNAIPNTAPNTAPPDTPTRGDGSDTLAQRRARLSAEQHAAQLAAQARVEEAERGFAAAQARVAELEAAASKAATVEGAQRHELALVERKHSLELERQRQQWALDDARRERDRQIVEVERAHSATATAQHVAETRRQCDATASEVAALRAACAGEQNRINLNSVGLGAVGGTILTILGINLRAPDKRTRRTGATAATGIVGVASAAAPFVLPMLRSTSSLPQPSTPSGLDAYLLSLIAERDRLHAELTALRATALSPMALGAGAITYALAG